MSDRRRGGDLWQRSCNSNPWCWMWFSLLLLRPHQSFFMVHCCLMKGHWVCLLDWNCIKERERRKESVPVCHWSENSSMAAWFEQMKGLILFDNIQQWVMTPKPPTPSHAFAQFHSQLFPEAWPYLLYSLCYSLCYTLPFLPLLYALQPAAYCLCAPR